MIRISFVIKFSFFIRKGVHCPDIFSQSTFCENELHSIDLNFYRGVNVLLFGRKRFGLLIHFAVNIFYVLTAPRAE